MQLKFVANYLILFLQLSSPPLSIPLENVKFGSCSMESDKFITVCETGQSQIAIVDMAAGSSVSRQKISAEAAIMNPLSKVIALKGKLEFITLFCYLNFNILIYFPQLARCCKSSISS